jgi:hypothetical protein
LFKVLTGKTKEKRPLGRPRRRWENSARIDKEMGIHTRNRVNSAQDKHRTEHPGSIIHGVKVY